MPAGFDLSHSRYPRNPRSKITAASLAAPFVLLNRSLFSESTRQSSARFLVPPTPPQHVSCAPPCVVASGEDGRWFHEQVQPHEPKLRAWLRARFPSLTDTDDLVQESYARLLRARQNGAIGNRNEELEILREAMHALPTRCRQVFTLRKLYGLSHRDIAAQLGISEKTVEEQVNRAMRRCAAFLRQRGVP